MAGTGGSSILDLEALEKGGPIPKDDDPSFQAGYPVQNTMASDPTLLAQAVNPAVYPVPNAMVSVPMVQPVTPVENRTHETYQAAKQYDFWEENQNYEIHVCIHKKAHTNNAKSNYYTSGDDKIKHKEIIIANFLVDSITKVITEGLVQETVEFVIKCSYYDDAERQEQTIEISVDEETFSGTYLVQAFRTAFGSKHTPFPPKKNADLDALLSKYLLDRYHEYPKELRRTPMPELNGVRYLSESEKKSIAKWFHKLYDPYNCGMELLLATTFGAICRDKLESLDARILPAMTKTLVVYGCTSNEQRNMIAALLSTTSDGITKQKLSEIKVTSNHDELKPLIFESQYQPLVLIDDTISDYAKKQNIAKIQMISEYVSSGIQRSDGSVIPCSAVVFTTRKLSEFKDISENCIFIDASELTMHEFDAEEIQILASKFLNLLYDNADHDLKSQKVQNILDNTLATDTAQKKIIMLCDIYRHIVQGMFDTYGIGNSEEELVLNRRHKKRRKTISTYLNENHSIFSPEITAKHIIYNLNELIQNDKLCIKLYDKSLTATNQALLYEHSGEAVLLFSNEYFESLFASPVEDGKTLREILSEHGCSVINEQSKKCFRMPIDERKLYTTIKVSVLDEKTREKLPDLHPCWVPDLNDGVDRVFLANDEHGNPIYWSVGKLENRSVLVQGNTRMGKTYFVTTKLIMGLHRLGYRVLIFDSARSSYNDYELGKCDYNTEFITENFYHGTATDAAGIMDEFENSLNKVYIVNRETNNTEKLELCDLLFKYQDNEFDANQQNTVPLFVVFEEAGDCKLLFDEDNVKRIYNQGSKMKLSTITILQMFVGEGSKRFQRMAGQALLKVSFKCATEGIRYLTEVIPPDHREFVKSRIPMLGIGQALICGEFEKSDGSFEADCYVTEKPDLRHHS